jgi:hypothetical protein
VAREASGLPRRTNACVERAQGRTGPSFSTVAVAVAAMGLAEARRTLDARSEEPENALLAAAFESPAHSSATLQ